MFFWSNENTERLTTDEHHSSVRNPDETQVRWVRSPFMIVLFIVSSWAVGLVSMRQELLSNWPVALGRFVMISAVVVSFYGLLVVREDDLIKHPRRMLVYGCLILATVTLAGITLLSGRSPFLVPLTLLTMILTIGFSTSLAIESYLFVFLLATSVWFPEHMIPGFSVSGQEMFQNKIIFFMTLGVMAPGSIAAALLSSTIRKRNKPLETGFVAGFIHVVMLAGLSLLLLPNIGAYSDPEIRMNLIYNGIIGFSNGVVSGAILLIMLPVIEKVFGIPTDLGLLELTDMNQPALRKLAMEAPGTYHHSLRVGTLSEAAAEVIDADPLLARVGAYYHDIGKTTKPQYFIENNKGGENPHEKLPSNMSKLILLGHVRDGLELADRYGLPEWIKNFIEQHHGTSVTEYFFAKQVQKKLAQGEEPDVETADFRYPGPLPQTKEIGICMLADSVEATSRSLDDPTPSKIKSMVERIVRKKIQDGQLDESGLTMGDLKIIRRAFVEALSGMLHARVKYPGQEEEELAEAQEEEEEASAKDSVDEPREDETGEEKKTEPGPVPEAATGQPSSRRNRAEERRDQEDPDGQRVFVLDQQNDMDIDENRVRDLTRFVLDAENSDQDVSIVYLKKSEMRDLNRQYLQEDRPTDVLSFPMDGDDWSPEVDNLLGEVMICPVIARSRASDHGNSMKREADLYLVHGLLHLLGYDDKTEEEEQKMETRQEELLDAFDGTRSRKPAESSS